mmetsp:Transcript_113333/g.252822  ORF Transcript_113333/g.252822 Transcript_113333/m.252822 type:complete len:202 (+) Transcript_113333:1-606(+)
MPRDSPCRSSSLMRPSRQASTQSLSRQQASSFRAMKKGCKMVQKPLWAPLKSSLAMALLTQYMLWLKSKTFDFNCVMSRRTLAKRRTLKVSHQELSKLSLILAIVQFIMSIFSWISKSLAVGCCPQKYMIDCDQILSVSSTYALASSQRCFKLDSGLGISVQRIDTDAPMIVVTITAAYSPMNRILVLAAPREGFKNVIIK